MKFYFVALCLLCFIISFSAVIGFTFFRAKSNQLQNTQEIDTQITPAFLPLPLEYENIPPAQSLSGKITLSSGEVRKFPRSEEATVVVDDTQTILEGEQLIASKSASANISFGTADTLSINPETILSFVSTNPKNFLILLRKGSVEFETDETVATISARSLHGLFSISDGKAALTTDSDKKIIRFSIEEGIGNVGYIDTDNNTQSVEVKPGITFIFDDQKRTFTVKPL